MSSGRSRKLQVVLDRISRIPLVALALVVWCSPKAVAAGRPVVLSASDGTVLSGTYYEASRRPAPAVVLVHMLGRSKEEWTGIAARLQDVGITALAIDLRGHGHSGGDRSMLPAMVGDVESAIDWLSGRLGVHPGAIGLVGASLGANLAALAAAERPDVRAIAMISPSLDYRGLRIDTAVVRKLGKRPLWLAASTEDPYALRTIKELATDDAIREQRLSGIRGHGTPLLAADPELVRALVDWLQRTLIF
jgi:pimeloyl-ACP methyl ester carboxylesterase